MPSVEENTFWDGLFYGSTWFGRRRVVRARRALSAGYRVTRRSMIGLLLARWGIFNVVEGIVDHHIVTVDERTRTMP